MTGPKRLLPVVIATLLGACTTVAPPGMQARSTCHSEPGGWCGFTRDMAVASYEYAPLAQNAYPADEETYTVLPGGITMRALVENDEYGFAYSIFDRFEGELLTEVIIAFRGTDIGSLDDWRHGNIGTMQQTRGVQLYEAERAQLDAMGWKDTRISVTGHSLGGAIAAEVSLMHEDVTLRIFNSSPHFADIADAPPGDRIAISEQGEALQLLRRDKNFPGHDAFILDCNPRESPVRDHKMRPLGDCLMWIAAYEDAAARDLLERNGVKPPAQNRYCDADGTVLPHPGPAGYGAVRPQLCEGS